MFSLYTIIRPLHIIMYFEYQIGWLGIVSVDNILLFNRLDADDIDVAPVWDYDDRHA